MWKKSELTRLIRINKTAENTEGRNLSIHSLVEADNSKNYVGIAVNGLISVPGIAATAEIRIEIGNEDLLRLSAIKKLLDTPEPNWIEEYEVYNQSIDWEAFWRGEVIKWRLGILTIPRRAGPYAA